MFFGGALSESPWQWLAVTMIMCVLIEGAVFKYSLQYRRPFLASLYANTISLLAGIPLALLGAVDPTGFVLATAVSIIIEYYAIRGREQWFESAPSKIRLGPILTGNLVTNGVMFGFLVLGFLDSRNLLPFSWD